MAIDEKLIDQLLTDYKKPEDIIGENGLLKELTKAILERALQAEMTDHLGYEKHDPAGHHRGNSRNGNSQKTLKGEFGELELETPRDQHSFLWPTANGMQDLGTLGGTDAEASMINDLGVVVGGSQLQGDSQYDAFLWDGQMHDLGTLDGANCAYAYAINKHMQVVGNTGYDCGTKAFLWEDGGPMVNLSNLVSNTRLTALGVININDGGEIAG